MPSKKDSVLQFVHHNHKLKIPFVIYADFECLLQPVLGAENDPNQPVLDEENDPNQSSKKKEEKIEYKKNSKSCSVRSSVQGSLLY